MLALGSYEASAVLLAILLAYEILVPREEGDTRRGAAVTLLPFFGLLGAYLLMRRAVFGVVIGGYDDVGARLREDDVELVGGQLVPDAGQAAPQGR